MPNFNIHPLLVHFPIALLVVYSLLEWIPIKRLTSLSCWFYIKAAFLLFGVLSTIPTGLSGEIIEGQFQDKHALVDLHSKFAIAASAVYSLLLVLYFFTWFFNLKGHRPLLLSVAIIFLSLLGFFLILTTGALGGVIVYGPDLDPFTAFVYGLFFN